MTDKMQVLTPGKLKISLSSDSVFLGQAVPIEVRDSRHRLISRTTSTSLQLPAGLYEISAVLEDGRRHSAVVDVVGGEQTPITLVADEDSTAESEAPPPTPRPPSAVGPTPSGATVNEALLKMSFGSGAQNRFTRKMFDRMEDASPPSEAAGSVTFVEAQGAQRVRETRTLHIFQCDPAITAVPTATFAAGTRRLITSLPISPGYNSPSASCAVRIESVGGRLRAQAWIAPQRTVANALQNMLASDYLLQAAEVATSASELLSSKYEDPTGAALGALLLYKTGRLERFESWVENLARDFDWLPDGKILLARVRADRGRPSSDTLEQCLRAATQRPLFAECHALLLDLLRRWPGGDARDMRAKAVAELSAVAPFVDSAAICFSHWVPAQEEL